MPSSDPVTSLADIARILDRAPRMELMRIIQRGADFIELYCNPGSLSLLWPERWQDSAELGGHLSRAGGGGHDLMLVGTDVELAGLGFDILTSTGVHLLPVPAPAVRAAATVAAACRACAARGKADRLDVDLERARRESNMLISVGRALSQHRDLRSLLDMILLRAREVTGADAGSIYVVEGTEEDMSKRILRFAVSQNDTITVESKDFTMPVSAASIVGFAVLSREIINIPDLHALDAPGDGNNPWGAIHDRSFDDRYGYQARSMLTLPMISARQQVIGVIQLINKKRGGGRISLHTPSCFAEVVMPFDAVSENFAASLASQAGIAVENALLYEEVKTLFEGFVRASVTAIESRDPTTSGHSERVARLTVGMARTVDGIDRGSYAEVRFTTDDLKQIEYAALLHDFGKVGVREHVLVKAKKLYPHERDLIRQRFELIKKTLLSQHLASKVSYLLQASREQAAAEMSAHMGRLEAELAVELGELDEFMRVIMTCNEPTVLEQGGFERLADLAARRYPDGEGREQPYLTDDEVAALQIMRGSLTRDERAEIESHVVHTYNFLKQIPWGRTFRKVPEIAGAHHEKLDGTGYPHGLMAEHIPAPARMMTISDIYDALTASDRPYKKAMPLDRALDILAAEVRRGAIDGELFQIFLDARIYELTR